MQNKIVVANQIKFEVLSTGSPGQFAPVVFLHGWPETNIMWDNIMKRLSEHHNLYCLAPNLRGFTQETIPGNVSDYRLENLQADVLAIADTLKIARFHLVAHDWGSIIGWMLSANHPERVLTYSSLSIPHPSAFSKALRKNFSQKWKSIYMFLFQIPKLAELFLRTNNYKILHWIWKDVPDTYRDSYLKVFKNPENLKAGINYYRANFKRLKTKKIKVSPVTIPVQLIWGNRDRSVSRFGIQENKQYMTGAYNFVELNADHFLVHEKPEEVYRCIEGHIHSHKS